MAPLTAVVCPRPISARRSGHAHIWTAAAAARPAERSRTRGRGQTNGRGHTKGAWPRRGAWPSPRSPRGSHARQRTPNPHYIPPPPTRARPRGLAGLTRPHPPPQALKHREKIPGPPQPAPPGRSPFLGAVSVPPPPPAPPSPRPGPAHRAGAGRGRSASLPAPLPGCRSAHARSAALNAPARRRGARRDTESSALPLRMRGAAR